MNPARAVILLAEAVASLVVFVSFAVPRCGGRAFATGAASRGRSRRSARRS
jgi:hypothetical protein